MLIIRFPMWLSRYRPAFAWPFPVFQGVTMCEHLGCKEPGIVRCGICGTLICGRHGYLGKLYSSARCFECKPPNPTIGCGECPSCEEGHPERCQNRGDA